MVRERTDRRPLRDPRAAPRGAGVAETELLSKAQRIYAAVIGLGMVRLTAGHDRRPPLPDPAADETL